MRLSLKRVFLLGVLPLGLLAAACGGGGGGINPTPAPTPTPGPFSAATLNGTYAFSMSGQDNGGFFARIGSFAANGSGGITEGVEDVNSSAVGSVVLAFTSGSYTLSSNGKGVLNLTNQTGTLGFSIVMTSPTSGLITETDGNATASGNFTLQNPDAFTVQSINTGFVFDFSGVDNSGAPESRVGQFIGNGAGGADTLVDVNNGATASGPQNFPTDTFVMDTANGPTFGRGIANVAGLNMAFYIVDDSHIKFLETDFPALTLGDAVAQTGTIPTTTAALNGNFAFILGGASLSGSDVRAGRFSLGSGAINTGTLMMNDNDSSNSGSGNSNPVAIPDGSLSSATYTIDTTASVVGSGRGTIAFTDSKAGTFSFIFYLSSPTQGVIQDNSAGIVADGSIRAQTGGSFTTSGAAGNWAFNFSGQSINSTNGVLAAEDFLGQYAQTSSGGISGAVDFTELSAGSVVTDGAITGSLAATGDGAGRNSYSITLGTSPSTTLNFAAYFVDANTIFVVGTDTHRIITGTVARNF